MDLGARDAGASIVYANEINADACRTLRSHFPETRIDEGDVTQVTDFPSADLVLGGYPCQSFSMGGNRNPKDDHRTYLYLQFARCLAAVEPRFFIAENVSGLKSLRGGAFLREQCNVFEKAGSRGYRLTAQVIDARDYGVPQKRKRLFIVGVRRDLERVFLFPEATHGKNPTPHSGLLPYASHGEAIKDLPLWPQGEFYERPHDPEGHFSWYYMSRNRKAPWDAPSYTIVANWRHVTLHPASPTMSLTWSNLADGWKQRWDFTGKYEHTERDSNRPTLNQARRLSWRENALIQTFPSSFEPFGDVESKFEQIGNAVPPLLARTLVRHLISEAGLFADTDRTRADARAAGVQLEMWT